MTQEIPKPAEIRKAKGYLWRRILSKWPFLVWLGMAVFTYSLHQRGVRFERMNGVVFAETEVISALEDGVIASMSVNATGEAVAAGQLVVQIDDRAALALLEEEKQDIAFDSIEQSRKYGSLKSELTDDIATLNAEKAGDEARLDVLEKNLVNLKLSAEKNLIPGSKVTEAQLEIETLRASLPFYSTRLNDLKGEMANIDALLARLEAFNQTEPAVLQTIKDQIDRMKLKSISGGSVSQIYFRTGAVVKRGEPIVEIINVASLAARGFIVEENADKVKVGQKVFISPTGEAAAADFPATISYIAPQISSTPDIGSSVAGRVIKGRIIICNFDDADIDILPGQSISIHLEKPGKFKPFDFGKK